MKRPMGLKPLNLVKVNETPQFGKMLADEVCYVHGSNSSSFPGLVRFRALLSMEEIDGTSWFDRNRLGSGERGYTSSYLSKSANFSRCEYALPAKLSGEFKCLFLSRFDGGELFCVIWFFPRCFY